MNEKLFNHYQVKGLLNEFSDSQISKFRYACSKAIMENPHLDFNDLVVACDIYYSIIRDFPNCDIGDIIVSEQL